MYTPNEFKERDRGRIAELIENYGFGLLITVDGVRPCGSHLPFLYERNRLLVHLARSNPQVEHLERGNEVLAAFTGPHAYISPTWYESTSVPTWNYAVVHIYGIPKRMTQSALRDFVGRLATRYEAREREPWNLHYIPSLLDAIVGFEIEITEVQGKFKLSQNRPEADRASVIERLKERGSDSSVATAALMERISRTEKGGA